MPVCRSCGEEVDELFRVKVRSRWRKLCEDCVEEAERDEAIAAEGEEAVRRMMGWGGGGRSGGVRFP